MKIKKRSKRSRLRGSKTAGYGYRKKHKGGKGEHGGRGMAGTGKRAGHKIMWVYKYAPNYFGKRGFKSRKKIKSKLKIINIDDIEEKLEKFLQSGVAKKTAKGMELNLKKYKILGRGDIKNKIIIHAGSISKEAREKIVKAGGEILEKRG